MWGGGGAAGKARESAKESKEGYLSESWERRCLLGVKSRKKQEVSLEKVCKG